MTLIVTIDQSEGISGADIPEQAVKINAYRLRRRVPASARFLHFLLLNDFPPPSRSLEQATIDVFLVNCCLLYTPWGRGLLLYLRSIGMCRRIGSGFRGSPSLNRVSFLPCWRCVAGVIVSK